VVGVLVCLVLAGFASFYASTKPDGLSFVAGEHGFLGSVGPHTGDGSPFAGYETKGVDDARVSRGTAGIVGGALVFVIAGGLFLAVRRRDGDTRDGDTRDGDTAPARTPADRTGPDRDDA
jgi:cobalt/nickel transport system permease protein/cobalt/nickel transport protein